jgi:hypothetical protein
VDAAVTLDESGSSETVPAGVIRAMATVPADAVELVWFENQRFPSGPVVNADAPK